MAFAVSPEQLFGGLFQHSERVPEVAAILSPEDFEPQDRVLFEAILALYKQEGHVTLSGVKDWLDSQGDLVSAGGAARLGRLDAQQPECDVTAAAIRELAFIQRKHARYQERRHLQYLDVEGKLEAVRLDRLCELIGEGDDIEEADLEQLTPEEIFHDKVPEAIADRLLFRNTPTMIGGLPKRGKTYVCTQLALALSAGRDFLGLPVKQKRVLYCSWEVIAAELLRRMEAISEDLGYPDPRKMIKDGLLSMFAHTLDTRTPSLDLRRRDSPDWERLARMIQRAEAEVVILDTLSKVAAIPDKDTKATRECARGFADFCRQHGVSILVIHHTSRMREEMSVAASLAGSQAWGSDFPALLRLTDNKEPNAIDLKFCLEASSWYGDQPAPIWYQRPRKTNALGEEVAGFGCVVCDPPEPKNSPTVKLACIDQMENMFQAHRWRMSRETAVEILQNESGKFTQATIQRAAKECDLFAYGRGGNDRGKSEWIHPRHPEYLRLKNGGKTDAV